MDMSRATDAALFHGADLRERPYAFGPVPEPELRQLAEAAAQMLNPRMILESGESIETMHRALEISFAAMWAAGFKTAAQALGPTD
jgi:hypothetical protein